MLCCISKSANHGADIGDVRFLELLAGTIGAVVNAPGDTDLDRRNEFRDRIGRVVASGQLRAVFQPILHSAPEGSSGRKP